MKLIELMGNMVGIWQEHYNKHLLIKDMEEIEITVSKGVKKNNLNIKGLIYDVDNKKLNIMVEEVID